MTYCVLPSKPDDHEFFQNSFRISISIPVGKAANFNLCGKGINVKELGLIGASFCHWRAVMRILVEDHLYITSAK